LHPAPERAEVTWTLAVHDVERAPEAPFSWAADEDLAGGAKVRLERRTDGTSRLTYSDTGTFDVTANGERIDWYRSPDAPYELARTDILGRVLSIAAHAKGMLMLHASGVEVGGEVAGFLAPKFFGKSTLACALTDAGARLVTDDALAVRAGNRVECAPGVPAIRLRQQSAAHLRFLSGALEPDSDGWRHLERREMDQITTDWAPLGALYVLHPQPPEAMSSAASREPMDGANGALALVRFAKLGGLLRGMLAVDYLGTAAAIASRTPIYTLHYARDLARLAEVASVVSRWHRG
jgi:hypothetical protein